MDLNPHVNDGTVCQATPAHYNIGPSGGYTWSSGSGYLGWPEARSK
jgi:hypothetical protein